MDKVLTIFMTQIYVSLSRKLQVKILKRQLFIYEARVSQTWALLKPKKSKTRTCQNKGNIVILQVIFVLIAIVGILPQMLKKITSIKNRKLKNKITLLKIIY